MPTSVAAFRRLHEDTTPLLLPNAWDAGSARLFETLGARAVATTSAGVSWALGYGDGRLLAVSEVMALASRMIRVVEVPLSIDIENGYSDDPRVVAGHALRLAELGIVGINIEDGRDQPALLASKIEAIRNAVSKANLDLFVNTRCDVFLASLVEKSKLIDETISRGKLYARAGADGFFVPGIKEAEHITTVTGAISLPLNVMAWPGLAAATALGKLGVRRLSAGSAISQVLWGRAEELACAFLQTGDSGPISQGAMPYPRLQGLFPKT
jgi:2-methylisocitrate lyase-like PEP mutase family enzyme